MAGRDGKGLDRIYFQGFRTGSGEIAILWATITRAARCANENNGRFFPFNSTEDSLLNSAREFDRHGKSKTRGMVKG